MNKFVDEELLEALAAATEELEALFEGALESNARLSAVIEAETPKNLEETEGHPLQEVA